MKFIFKSIAKEHVINQICIKGSMNNIDLQFAGEIRSIRERISRSQRVDYVTTYTEREFFDGKTRDERVLILRTRGCSWSYHSGCSMCGFWEDTNPNITKNEIMNQIESFLKEYSKGDVLKIFTSGSFFDPIEISEDIQLLIIQKLLENYNYLIVESRPEYIINRADKLKEFAGRIQVAIGMESTDPAVLKYLINKNYDFEDFKEAAQELHKNGISVRAYLLMKPPFMKEDEAIRDTIQSARAVADYADFISINPMNIQKGTLVETLYKEGNYRPPWLWSVVEVLLALKDIKIPVVSLITASGKRRGPHNGHSCDRSFSEAIRKYSETLNFSYLENLQCECRTRWESFRENETTVPIQVNEALYYDL